MVLGNLTSQLHATSQHFTLHVGILPSKYVVQSSIVIHYGSPESFQIEIETITLLVYWYWCVSMCL